MLKCQFWDSATRRIQLRLIWTTIIASAWETLSFCSAIHSVGRWWLFASQFLIFLDFSWLAPPPSGIDCETVGSIPQYQRRSQQHDLQLQPRSDGDSLPAASPASGPSMSSSFVPRQVQHAPRYLYDWHGREVRGELEVWQRTVAGPLVSEVPRLLQQFRVSIAVVAAELFK